MSALDASRGGSTEAGGTAARGAGAPEDTLLRALEVLRGDLADLRLPLQLPGAEAARRARAGVVDQLDDYLLPRLRQIDAPLLTVVGGSTGAGKSTLVNSVLRERLTRTGVLRPTTRSPVLVHHPEDARWFTGDRVLPSLARVTGEDPDRLREPGTGAAEGADPGAARRTSSVRLVASEALPAGLALLDAPDIDSVVAANRELAAQLLAAADLWMFVTTAARYADAVPWELLRGAAARGASVAVVLDRVPNGPGDEAALQEIREDLERMLREAGLGGSPLFAVLEQSGGDRGQQVSDEMLPEAAVAPIRGWLLALAGDARARAEVVRRTLTGALDALPTTLRPVVEGAAAQEQTLADLRADVARSFARSREGLEEELTDGSLLRGEVLARWQEFVGTGEFFRALDSAVGRVRDRVASFVRGRPAPSPEPVGQALHSGVTALVRSRALAALDATAAAWAGRPGGEQVVADAGEHLALPPDFDERAARLVRDWQRAVLELVREEGAGRRSRARVLSFGVNALGVALMIVVFASTAFIPTGAEVGVGLGTAAVGQRLLEAVFGDAAVRALAARARRDLLARVDELLEGPRSALIASLEGLGVGEGVPARLRADVAAVEQAR